MHVHELENTSACHRHGSRLAAPPRRGGLHEPGLPGSSLLTVWLWLSGMHYMHRRAAGPRIEGHGGILKIPCSIFQLCGQRRTECCRLTKILIYSPRGRWPRLRLRLHLRLLIRLRLCLRLHLRFYFCSRLWSELWKNRNEPWKNRKHSLIPGPEHISAAHPKFVT